MELQEFIFDSTPTRKQLLDYSPVCDRKFKICVYRNHSFELVEHTIFAYLDYAGIGVEFIYSDYDDSLSFLSLPADTDMLILWLDIGRYKIDDINSFINERLNYLTGIYHKPILFVPFRWEGDIANELVTCYDMKDIAEQIGEKALDLRMEPYTGTCMSAKAITMVSRRLGLNYIPALLMPALKAVVVDLDNTLYRGVLGEDGKDGIELTEGHKALMEKLSELSSQGFFICVASKNEESDVIELFDHRADFPLKRSDLSKLCVSWDSKAESISKIAQYLNIGIDSILFIDDNPGEINSVLSMHPQVHTIRAYDDATKTLEVLNSYPRMMKLASAREDQLRKDDIIANEKRRELQQSMSADEYIRSLGMTLTFVTDCPEQAQRVSELSNKTNQFIFSYGRYSLSDIQDRMAASDHKIITISLSDRLSDSGIIGVCCAAFDGSIIDIEECFVSCRALGRGIDECIVLGAIELACQHFGCRNVKIRFTEGERNLPAKKFLEKNFSTTDSAGAECFEYSFPKDLLNIIIKEN